MSGAVHELIITHGGTSSLAGKTQRLPGGRVRLGRAEDNEIVFDPEERVVSAHHAEIELRDGRPWIADAGSQNGTLVNGAPIDDAVALDPGDIVQLGPQGPQLRVEVMAGGGKHYIGQETLERAIRTATSVERAKVNRRFRAGAAVGALLVVVAALVLWQVFSGQQDIGRGQQELREDQDYLRREVEQARREAAALHGQMENDISAKLAAYDGQLEGLRGKISDGEAQIARTLVEIQERDKAIQKINERSDLSDKQRQAVLAEARAGVESLKKTLETKIREVRDESATAEDWGTLATRYAPGVFLLVGETPTGEKTDEGKALVERNIGTAFSIRSDGLLATNAHVVEDLQSASFRVAIQNGTGRFFPVIRSIAHPDFVAPTSPDVGLVEIETNGDEIPVLALANEEELRKVTIGTHLGTIGYPGELSNLYLTRIEKGLAKAAAATFKDGWIGRITDYEMSLAAFEDALFFQHSASTSGGTSGSPMFTASGKVVAINNAVIEVNLEDKGPEGTDSSLKRMPTAAELASAIRIDVLTEFWTEVKW